MINKQQLSPILRTLFFDPTSAYTAGGLLQVILRRLLSPAIDMKGAATAAATDEEGLNNSSSTEGPEAPSSDLVLAPGGGEVADNTQAAADIIRQE